MVSQGHGGPTLVKPAWILCPEVGTGGHNHYPGGSCGHGPWPGRSVLLETTAVGSRWLGALLSTCCWPPSQALCSLPLFCPGVFLASGAVCLVAEAGPLTLLLSEKTTLKRALWMLGCVHDPTRICLPCPHLAAVEVLGSEAVCCTLRHT